MQTCFKADTYMYQFQGLEIKGIQNYKTILVAMTLKWNNFLSHSKHCSMITAIAEKL
jgi:hypothetical protein